LVKTGRERCDASRKGEGEKKRKGVGEKKKQNEKKNSFWGGGGLHKGEKRKKRQHLF